MAEDSMTKYKDLAALGAALADPFLGQDGQSYVLAPSDWSIQRVPRLERPAGLEEVRHLATPESFARYVNQFKESTSLLFAYPATGVFEAILDYHASPVSPAWCSHRARLQMQPSPEWRRWQDHNGRAHTQEQFVEFLEDERQYIASPDGATLLEIVRTLEAKKSIEFRSAVRLADGSRELAYSEEVKGRSSAGRLEVPELFGLLLRPFLGTDPIQVTARLRYRIREGALSVSYKLANLPELREEAFGQVCDAIEAETEFQPFISVEEPPTE